MPQRIDQPAMGRCAKGTLAGLVRTGVLLMGAILASVFMVDFPMRAGEAPTPYVPASDRWIELGTPPQPETQRAAEADAPAADPSRPDRQKPSRRGDPHHANGETNGGPRTAPST